MWISKPRHCFQLCLEEYVEIGSQVIDQAAIFRARTPLRLSTLAKNGAANTNKQLPFITGPWH